MIEEMPFFFIENNDIPDSHRHKIVELNLNIFDKSLNFKIGARDCTAKISDLVPVARAVSGKVIRLVTNKLASDGNSVSCRKGCCHCCHYLLPVSTPEAFRLAYEILTMPPIRQEAILISTIDAAKKIMEHGLPEPENNPIANRPDLQDISNWYKELTLPCPFLVDDSCCIYNIRPLVCREYMVTSPPDNCKKNSTTPPDTVTLPVTTAKILMDIADELESDHLKVIPLPLSLVWCQANHDHDLNSYAAPFLLERFTQSVRLAVENYTNG